MCHVSRGRFSGYPPALGFGLWALGKWERGRACEKLCPGVQGGVYLVGKDYMTVYLLLHGIL